MKQNKPAPTLQHFFKGSFRVLLPALLSGCAVGPNFKRPELPASAGYTAKPLETTSTTTNTVGGETQRFVQDMDIPGEWWTLFHSQPLNDLVEHALKHNPDLKAAQAALRVARENLVAQRGSYFPTVSGSFNAERQRQSPLLSPVLNTNVFQFDLYTPQLSISYSPDVFGLNRRTVESLKAQEQQQRFQMLATYITLSANVVNAAIQDASLRGQVEATHRLIDINSKLLDLLRNQLSRGYASRLDVAAQESQLAQVTATLPPLLKQLAQQRDQLAVLVGDFPNQDPAVKFDLATLHLPEDLPVSLPAKLVQQRPDVRQAEENLHSACAQIGVAIANRLPDFVLTADIGSTALKIEKLFSGGTGFWQIAGGVTQPIFEGGALLHKQRAAKAAFDQATEQYRSTVHNAFQNVADTLNALEQDGEALKAAAAAEQAAKVTLDLTNRQMQSGYINYLALLSAEQTYQQASITLRQAQANRYADTAALFQSLGGGWWHRADLAQQ